MTTTTITTPSGTEITCAAGSGRYSHTASLVAGGRTISGKLSGPVALRRPERGATHSIGVGRNRIGIDAGQAENLTRWLDEQDASNAPRSARKPAREIRGVGEVVDGRYYR